MRASALAYDDLHSELLSLGDHPQTTYACLRGAHVHPRNHISYTPPLNLRERVLIATNRTALPQNPNPVPPLSQPQVLMSTYGMMFNRMGTTCAQILITESDLLSRERYSYLTGTLERLMELKAIPIINECRPLPP